MGTATHPRPSCNSLTTVMLHLAVKPAFRTIDRPSLLSQERKATLLARHENRQRNPPYGSEPTVAKANAIGPCDPVCGFTELRTPEELALAYTGRGTLRRKNSSRHRDRARDLPDFGVCS